jgi:hypothetical protein
MRSVPLAILIAVSATTALPAREAGDEEPPREIGLEERSAARLAQFELSASGDPERIRSLVPGDLKIKIGLKKLTDYELDHFCGLPQGTPEEAEVSVPRPSYLMYFDQPHLTQSGRARAMDIARGLIPRLTAEGGRVTIVSNAASIETFSDLSPDPRQLLDAIDRLEADRDQWDTYASLETSRIDEIIRALNEADNIGQATALARRYQRFERWLGEKNLRRFEMVLGRLAGLDPPKAVLYFADTMRSNPGEHYLSIFSSAVMESSQSLQVMEGDAFGGRTVFDRVVRQASANGIRLYTVHAQGLVQQAGFQRLSPQGTSMGGDTYNLPMTRIRHAQDSLASMASETGGASFPHGAKASRIADRILSDLSCILLVSFDPARFDHDEPFRLKVESRKPGVKVHSRGQIVIQSASARTTSRLMAAFMAAFAMPGARAAEAALGISLVPIEFRQGKFHALLQIHAPGVPVAGATWDVGASVSAGGEVLEEVSGRVTLRRPGSPVILEKEIALTGGAVNVVAVAHETTTRRVSSVSRQAQWSAPEKDSAALGPVAALQPSPGAFLREGAVRTWGSLALDPDRTALGDRPLALVGIVCRGERSTSPLQVERRLVGEEETVLPVVDLEPTGEGCVQLRDVIPAGNLGPGPIRYEMRLLQEGEEIDTATREFIVIGSAPGSGSETGAR